MLGAEVAELWQIEAKERRIPAPEQNRRSREPRVIHESADSTLHGRTTLPMSRPGQCPSSEVRSKCGCVSRFARKALRRHGLLVGKLRSSNAASGSNGRAHVLRTPDAEH